MDGVSETYVYGELEYLVGTGRADGVRGCYVEGGAFVERLVTKEVFDVEVPWGMYSKQ